MKPSGPLVLGGLGLLLGTAALALGLSGVGSVDLDRSLGIQARLLAARVEQDHLGELVFHGAPGNDVLFEIWRGDGTPVARSTAEPGELARHGVAPGELSFAGVTLPDGRPGRSAEWVFVPATAAASAAPTSPLTATVVIAEPRPADRRALSIGLGVGSLGLLLAGFARARRQHPAEAEAIHGIARRITTFDAGSLGESLDPAEWPATARPLVETLNDLLARLKKAFDRERGFSANLAHEIRTPLAELRTLAEVAFRWPEDDPDAQARVFEEVYAIGLQMERIVDNLLAISRYETGHHALLTSEVSLAGALTSAWRGVAAEAEKRPSRLVLDVPADLGVTTDREKLALVLTNLLTNAVAHGDPGEVRCRAIREADHFVLSIANPVSGLVAADLERMFERKWRKDRGDRGRHSGLGLALVATLCRRLGLTVAADLPAPDRIEITLRGPVSGQAGGTVRHTAHRPI